MIRVLLGCVGFGRVDAGSNRESDRALTHRLTHHGDSPKFTMGDEIGRLEGFRGGGVSGACARAGNAEEEPDRAAGGNGSEWVRAGG
eukprot:scaffold11028_cov93-Isochrysis_galbana.AAC.3